MYPRVLNHRHQFVVVGRIDRRPRGRVKMADVGLVQFLPESGIPGAMRLDSSARRPPGRRMDAILSSAGLWLHPMKRLGEHNEIERPPGRPPVLECGLLEGDTVVGGDPRHARVGFHREHVCARLDHLRRRDARSRADVERSHMAAPDQLCDERPGVAGSVTVVVVGSEPKRLRPPPVGIRTWSPRHTPIMRRELGWAAYDVLGSCLQ